MLKQLELTTHILNIIMWQLIRSKRNIHSNIDDNAWKGVPVKVYAVINKGVSFTCNLIKVSYLSTNAPSFGLSFEVGINSTTMLPSTGVCLLGSQNLLFIEKRMTKQPYSSWH